MTTGDELAKIDPHDAALLLMLLRFRQRLQAPSDARSQTTLLADHGCGPPCDGPHPASALHPLKAL